MNNQSFISIGSNLGAREEIIGTALKKLEASPDISINKMSSLYETEPVGYTEQSAFINMVVAIQTNFSAYELLYFLQKIESDLGRKRDIRWGPRTIDLDILLYNDENIKSETLIIPHPRMFERGFVMIPLLEIHPAIIQQYTIEKLPDERGVTLWKQNIGEGGLERSEN